jgi:small subunit ribosomal protein S11
MAAKKKTTAKKKKNIKISYGLLHVKTSPNNTIVTLTDENGNKILGG